MEKQMRAERDRRAQVLEAEGNKQAMILEAQGKKESEINQAEGDKQSQILRAEAEAEAKIKVAQAEAESIRLITEAIDKNAACDPAKYLIAMKYIETLGQMTSGDDTKTVYIPYEATGVLSSIGGIKDMLEKTK
jgi:regulator of protease activity HflC (stomatin/prohibitin superfamily)